MTFSMTGSKTKLSFDSQSSFIKENNKIRVKELTVRYFRMRRVLYAKEKKVQAATNT
jgi:hypothetical protein